MTSAEAGAPVRESPTSADASEFAREWREWHDALDAARAAPLGFLAFTGFHLLDEIPRRLDGLPGLWSTGDGGPRVALESGESLEIDGTLVTRRHAWGSIGERTFHRAAFGDAAVEVSRRGGRDIVRALHPDHVLRRVFTGTPAFAPDPAWVIEATFLPEEPRDIPIEAAIPAIRHTHTTPGRARLIHRGQEHTLTLIARSPGTATLLFRDATSGVTTYVASRSLEVRLPQDGSDRVVLDFNRASNLQCAYTDYSPCPLAPPENLLPFAVEAGEKTPTLRADAAAPGGSAVTTCDASLARPLRPGETGQAPMEAG